MQNRKKIKKKYSSVVELYEDFGHCKGQYAKDKSGKPVFEEDEKAVRFCISGAIFRVYEDYEKASEARQKLSKIKENFIAFNDRKSTTKRQIVALAKKAGI